MTIINSQHVAAVTIEIFAPPDSGSGGSGSSGGSSGSGGSGSSGGDTDVTPPPGPGCRLLKTNQDSLTATYIEQPIAENDDVWEGAASGATGLHAGYVYAVVGVSTDGPVLLDQYIRMANVQGTFLAGESLLLNDDPSGIAVDTPLVLATVSCTGGSGYQDIEVDDSVDFPIGGIFDGPKYCFWYTSTPDGQRFDPGVLCPQTEDIQFSSALSYPIVYDFGEFDGSDQFSIHVDWAPEIELKNGPMGGTMTGLYSGCTARVLSVEEFSDYFVVTVNQLSIDIEREPFIQGEPCSINISPDDLVRHDYVISNPSYFTKLT